MLVRDRMLNAYELLGVSRTAEPDIIAAAFRSLSRQYGGRNGGRERLLKLEAAYDLLTDPDRRRDYDATIGEEVAITGPAMWQVKPRPSSASGPGILGRAAPARAPIPRTEGPPSTSPITPVEPPLRLAPLGPAKAKHLVIPDPDAEGSSDWLIESAPPVQLQLEDARTGKTFFGVPFGIPLAGGLVLLAAVLAIPLLTGGSPEGTDSRREAAPATLRLDAESTVPLPDRSSVEAGPPAGETLAPVPQSEAAGATDAGQESRESAPVEAASQPEAPPRPTPNQATGTLAEQTPRAAPPQPAPAVNPSKAAPAAPAPVATTIASPAVNQPQRQVAQRQAARPTPPQWVSGALQNSDNKKGQFQGVVGVSLTIRTDGRVGACRVTRSSGDSNLDQTTCGLAERRLMFSPAKDAIGRPVESEVSTTYTWGRRVRR